MVGWCNSSTQQTLAHKAESEACMAKLQRGTNINTKEYWNTRYANPKHSHPAFESTEKFFRFGFLPSHEECTVLDVGCGTTSHYNKIHELFPQAKLTGLDISPIAIQNNKKACTFADFLCLDIAKQSIPCTYDYIISAHTFEHLTDPLDALRKCRIRARKHVIICVPYKESWSYDHEHMHTFSEYEPFTEHDYYLVEFDVANRVGGIYFRFQGQS